MEGDSDQVDGHILAFVMRGLHHLCERFPVRGKWRLFCGDNNEQVEGERNGFNHYVLDLHVFFGLDTGVHVLIVNTVGKLPFLLHCWAAFFSASFQMFQWQEWGFF